ncbi:LexA family protein [Jeongeupia chitinilytica]|uniref:Peptidase S24/S26A/S26B/S26C domain-containing protein n=1 Tax=Jeongeupia chitinilytica TaxID=1041641 RepID=A0ABQ3GZ78_9NEIS|nr:translesion error-prone DNA polymerase V autoproteolytic subunit [Jeongeupia chitinilytica]GHD59909.1 hypothetical protein GCM10007350_11960 [Jeongeupia chitinilytica]
MIPELIGPIPAHDSPPPCALPLADVLVPAGFPSPAEDHAEERCDLNMYFIDRPEATFFFRVAGDSMVSDDPQRSIPPGALLVVDRSLEASHGDVVVAAIDGDFTVKRLFSRAGKVALVANNKAYPPIVLGDEQELSVWGVVTGWAMKSQR